MKLASNETLPLCWQPQVSPKLTSFPFFFYFFFFKKRDKAKLSLLLCGPLEIAAVIWAGFTIILLLLELPLGTSSTQRESDLPSIYRPACPGRVIKYSISKVVLFSFTDFALSFENWIPLQVKIKQIHFAVPEGWRSIGKVCVCWVGFGSLNRSWAEPLGLKLQTHARMKVRATLLKNIGSLQCSQTVLELDS